MSPEDSNENDINRIEELLLRNDLNSFERRFLPSIKSKLEANYSLTASQRKCLLDISERYSPEALLEQQQWEQSFTEEKKNNMRIIALYYKAQGTFFLDLANKILSDPDYIPTRRAYKKMCQNKYATRLIAEWHAPPKFSVSQVVYPRYSCPFAIRNRIKRGGVIVELCGAHPVSAAKGAKRHFVLPFGEGHAILVEERWLKSRR